MTDYDIIIIGGGLAGLTNAICLSKSGHKVLVIEKKNYPFNKVCGEYLSNETVPFLKSIGADLSVFNPAVINKLLVTSPVGSALRMNLPLGGIGITRYNLDNFLFETAKNAGAEFLLNTSVFDVNYSNSIFQVSTADSFITSKLVIGSFGKRSNLDNKLERSFFYKRSHYLGVKYHIAFEAPKDQIALHLFKDGYCGISATEIPDQYCLCYLTTQKNLKEHGSIRDMENAVLKKNPFLKRIFNYSEFLYHKPEVINEISFEKKEAVKNGIIMSGDSAGMISPLCGNGMAMAIHSAKVLSTLINKYHNRGVYDQLMIEKEYTDSWNKLFSTRLLAGKYIQQMFTYSAMTSVAISTLRRMPRVSKWIVQKTHGSESSF